jgi:hypothetical protein
VQYAAPTVYCTCTCSIPYVHHTVCTCTVYCKSSVARCRSDWYSQLTSQHACSLHIQNVMMETAGRYVTQCLSSQTTVFIFRLPDGDDVNDTVSFETPAPIYNLHGVTNQKTPTEKLVLKMTAIWLILYKEPARCNFGSTVYRSLQNYSTCFGRFLRPSSGVLKTVEAVTGACRGSGWCISSKDVWGQLPLHYVIAYLGDDIVQWQLTCTSGCFYSFQYSWRWTQKASETCRVILQRLINNTAKVAYWWFFI